MQVLLIRFIAKFGTDMEKLRDALVLRSFLETMGEAVAEAELVRIIIQMFKWPVIIIGVSG